LKEIVIGLFDEHGNLKQEYTENIQQHGIDLNLIKVERIIAGSGFIPKTGKTTLAERVIVMSADIWSSETYVWDLQPGAYELTFAQGCKVPKDQRMRILHRSSVLRNGGTINSGLFDAGFETSNIGAIMILTQPMIIEVGARVATAITEVSNEVENLYKGQWQNDKQRQDFPQRS
jgi:deoxycytidine triphosphate deaminase